MICPRKPKKPCPHMSLFDFSCEYSQDGKVCVLDPSPAELAQQLADLTGNAVVVYRQPEGHWMGCIFEDTCNIHDLPFRQGGEDPDNESWCDMGAFGEFFINRSVNYTGSWQDSKVTAEPNHIGNVNEKVALKQMAERNK